MQSPRTKAKIAENLGLLKQFLEKKYGTPVDDETERVLFNALDWTADDVENSSKSGSQVIDAEPDHRQSRPT
jgi:hypothetical protein